MQFGYEDLTFEDKGEYVRCKLFKRYFFDLEKKDLERVGKITVHPDSLEFDASEKKVVNKVIPLLEDGLTRHLRHQLYDKPAFYIREELNIPLIGSTEIGVVERGSNIIEVKPLTGCNFTCTYCSVDEGKNNKSYDYLVEEDYLVKATEEIAKIKKHPVEVNIGPHGEPLLYPKIVELVKNLKNIQNVEIVSVNTNGSLLSKKLIDELAAAGLTRINLSLPALDEKLASELAGVAKFPVQHLLDMLDYGKEKIDFLLAPVVIPSKNEGEMKKIVELSKTITSSFPTIGIQNYLDYPKGRRPVKKSLPWEAFFTFIKELEKESGKNLTSTQEDFHIFDDEKLEKPFRKNQTIECEICMPGRYPKEMYAKAQGRLINVHLTNDLKNIGKKLKVKVVRDKHNIFKAV
ncbi:radical SAM protein [Candidatus Woesearchaeota archaeon]|nr:radical SAM protein [Candidatus Woesearchaeota archaeon]